MVDIMIEVPIWMAVAVPAVIWALWWLGERVGDDDGGGSQNGPWGWFPDGPFCLFARAAYSLPFDSTT